MVIGGATLAVGFLIASQITALWQFYIVLGTFLGLGAAMIGLIPNSTLVSNWFVKRRGMALGIATMGVSLSGVIMAPLTEYLIASIGWRNTFVVYGFVTAAIVVPLAWYMIVNRPEDMGLLPDGAKGAPDPALDRQFQASEDWSALETIRDRNFWAITITIGLSFCSMGAVLTHMIPHVTDLGFSTERAALVISAGAGVAVVGKLLFGWITDHIDTRIALWLALSFQACGLMLLLNVDTYPMILTGAGIFGFGMGGIVPLWGSLIGEYFGRAIFGRIMGLMSPCMLPVQLLGVPYAGFVFDRTGSYDIAYETFLGVYVLAACVLLTLRPAPREERETAVCEAA